LISRILISRYTSKFIFASRYFEPWISVAVGIGSQNPANADGGGEEDRSIRTWRRAWRTTLSCSARPAGPMRRRRWRPVPKRSVRNMNERVRRAHRNETDTMSVFWCEGPSRRPANGGFGSCADLRHPFALCLEAGDQPTFRPEVRPSGGGRPRSGCFRISVLCHKRSCDCVWLYLGGTDLSAAKLSRIQVRNAATSGASTRSARAIRK